MSNGSELPQTPEAVAYQLMRDLISNEKGFGNDRDYWLDLYAECLDATKGSRTVAARNAASRQNVQANLRRGGA